MRSFRTRQAVVQAYKRAPFAPPWPLAASPRPNSKALALALSGYAQPAGADLPHAGRYLESLLGRIDALKLPVDGAVAWSYPFSVQTRHLYYSERTPNAIATCFVIEGLLDAAEATGEDAHAELALRARPFLVSLNQAAEPAPYFAYVEAGSELIHNANLLVCASLARLSQLDANPETDELVRVAAATTLRAQEPDGLWPYGAVANLGWADNFHTAYVLESLCRLDAVYGIGASELESGLAAWMDRFFEPDGAARYFPDRRYPLEPHSYASAIDLLVVAAARDEARAGEYLDLAEKIADSAVRELWLEDEGRFAFRRGPRTLNRRPFMRWTNAPMFRALARLASARGDLTP